MHPQLFGQVLKKSNNQSFEGRCVPNRMYACAFAQDADMAICDLSVIGLFKQLKTCIFEHFGREKRNDTCAALDEPKDGACTACREDRGPCPEGPGRPERIRAAGRTPILVSLRNFDRYSNTFVDIPSRPGSPNHISAGQSVVKFGSTRRLPKSIRISGKAPRQDARNRFSGMYRARARQYGPRPTTHATIPTKSGPKVSVPWRRLLRIVGSVASVVEDCRKRGVGG